jgi:hypothetical protein
MGCLDGKTVVMAKPWFNLLLANFDAPRQMG